MLRSEEPNTETSLESEDILVNSHLKEFLRVKTRFKVNTRECVVIKETAFIPKQFSFFQFNLLNQAARGTSSQTVNHDNLNDTLMHFMFEWAPVVLTACSIISYIPYSDQTRTRTRDTYLSFCFAARHLNLSLSVPANCPVSIML